MKESRGRARLLVALQFLLLALLVVNPFDAFFQVERFLVVVIYIAVGLILISAAVALGSALTASPIPKNDAELVTKGIYKWIRHPMYTALILLGIALFLGKANFFSLAVLFALALLLLLKSQYEDALLAQRHGDAGTYQKTTSRFLPKL